MSPKTFRYWSFISYSQKDERWAKWLHGRLETYRPPASLVGKVINGEAVPTRLAPIFRDREELPSSSDLSTVVRRALEDSASLVVICSPNAVASKLVNEEILIFKRLGKENRIFPIIIDGEPHASSQPSSLLAECFPMSLRFAVGANGELTDQSVNPLAADARTQGDGNFNAVLKVIAGILGVGFDDLRLRDQLRHKRKMTVQIAASLSIATAALVAYIAIADMGINIYGSTSMRDQVDTRQLSVFRRIASEASVQNSIDTFTADIRPLLRRGVAPDNKVKYRLEWPGPTGAWEGSEALSALLVDPETSREDAEELAALFERLFSDEFLVRKEERLVGWLDSQRGGYARGEPTIWVSIALLAALNRSPPLRDSTRLRLLEFLNRAQMASESFYNAADGYWVAVAGQIRPASSTYVTALALFSLNQCLETHLGWRKDIALARHMIENTIARLEGDFTEGVKGAGWGRTKDDEDGNNADLSLMIFGLLAESHVLLGTRLPPALEKAALAAFGAIEFRRYDSSGPDLRLDGDYLEPTGESHPLRISSKHLWYPWALTGSTNMLKYMHSYTIGGHWPTRIARGYGYLATVMIKDVHRDLMSDRTAMYRFAETYFGVLKSLRDRR